MGDNVKCRCKFKCDYNKILEKGTKSETAHIKMSPVYDTTEENKKFFKYTPGGIIELQVVNPEVSKQFIVGNEYYIDISSVK